MRTLVLVVAAALVLVLLPAQQQVFQDEAATDGQSGPASPASENLDDQDPDSQDPDSQDPDSQERELPARPGVDGVELPDVSHEVSDSVWRTQLCLRLVSIPSAELDDVEFLGAVADAAVQTLPGDPDLSADALRYAQEATRLAQDLDDTGRRYLGEDAGVLEGQLSDYETAAETIFQSPSAVWDLEPACVALGVGQPLPELDLDRFDQQQATEAVATRLGFTARVLSFSSELTQIEVIPDALLDVPPGYSAQPRSDGSAVLVGGPDDTTFACLVFGEDAQVEPLVASGRCEDLAVQTPASSGPLGNTEVRLGQVLERFPAVPDATSPTPPAP